LLPVIEQSDTVIKKKKVALVSHFGFGNLGDAAIQHAVIQNIERRVKDVKFCGVCMNPGDTESRYGIEAFPIGRNPKRAWLNPDVKPNLIVRLLCKVGILFPERVQRFAERVFIRLPIEFLLLPQAFRRAKECEVILVTCGGQLDDEGYSAWYHPYNFLKWSLLSRLANSKLAYVSAGAGPIHLNLSKRFLRMALSLAHYRSFRDHHSVNVVRAIGHLPEDPVYPDLAYSIQLSQMAINPIQGLGRPCVAIGAMSYYCEKVWPDSDSRVYLTYLEKLCEFVVWLIGRGYGIVLIPGESGADKRAIQDLRKCVLGRFPDSNAVDIRDPVIGTVDELLSVIASVDFVVTSRYHGVVLSHVLQKPVLAISYHPKVNALMDNMNLTEFCVDIDTFAPGLLQAKFEDLVSSADHIRTRMAQMDHIYRQKLDLQYDTLVQSFMQ
jgi:polysaccharide pyruvyl transferase WcaK-like protein